jgi:protein regulator of cytokinesis 1
MEYVDVLHGLCNVLGFDFLTIVREIHPTLDESSTAYNQVKNISDDTLTKLSNVVESLKLEKRKRMEQVIVV